MDDHKLGLEPTARANLRGWWGEDNCAMSVQGHSRRFNRLPSTLAVGTRVTSRPPHRSVRAQFGHTAPTSGM